MHARATVDHEQTNKMLREESQHPTQPLDAQLSYDGLAIDAAGEIVPGFHPLT